MTVRPGLFHCLIGSLDCPCFSRPALDSGFFSGALGVRMRSLFLANSEFAVISIHATRTNCRNPSIFRTPLAGPRILSRPLGSSQIWQLFDL
jgi:hypothetical protein